MLLSLDVETTGLDPNHDDVLEIAAILLDKDDNTIGEFSALVAGDGSKANDYVQDMHTQSGLWAALAAGAPVSREFADKVLAGWLVEHSPPKTAFTLLGRSVHFDASMLQAQFPLTFALLSHRRRDVSALGKILREWGLAIPGIAEGTPHRALSDARGALDEYWAWKRLIQSLVQLRLKSQEAFDALESVHPDYWTSSDLDTAYVALIDGLGLDRAQYLG